MNVPGTLRSGPETADDFPGGLRFDPAAGARLPLICVQGPSGPPTSWCFEGDLVRIGRAPSSDIVLESPSVSRFHLELRRFGNGWMAADLGSRNGTLLNDRRVVGQEPLQPGDVLRIGPVTLIFDIAVEGAVGAQLPTREAGQDVNGLADLADLADLVGLVGTSASLRTLRDGLPRVAASLATVLVTGESGTGKELVAQALHRLSPRSGAPFVVVNCPTLRGSLLESELFGVEAGVATGVAARMGRLEKAHRGTLFLDEVGDLDPVAQAMLLRFLQDHCIERLGGRRIIRLDVRVVAATNRDLEADVERGLFRQDLLHRLDVVNLRLVPLRERREDIPLLLDHFLRREGGRTARLSPDARRALLEHPYPGNVRQLEHAVETALLLAGGSVIRMEHLPASFRRGSGATGASRESDPRAGRPTSANAANAANAVASRASALLALIADGASFWDLVRVPYLRRELSREVVVEVLRQARERAGRHANMKDVARVLGVESQHKKLLNFVWSQRLRERDREEEPAGASR